MKLKNNSGRINLIFRASSYQPFDRLTALSGADGLKRNSHLRFDIGFLKTIETILRSGATSSFDVQR